MINNSDLSGIQPLVVYTLEIERVIVARANFFTNNLSSLSLLTNNSGHIIPPISDSHFLQDVTKVAGFDGVFLNSELISGLNIWS